MITLKQRIRVLTTLMVAGCCLSGGCQTAMAGVFHVDVPLQTPAASPLQGASHSQAASPQDTTLPDGYVSWTPLPTLSQEGTGFVQTNSSFGKGMNIKDALRLILPEGWKVYAKPGISGGIAVTWKARNQPWTVPLRIVLGQSGLIGTVNWPHQALLLRVRPEPAVKPLDTKGYTSWNSQSSLPAHFHEGPVVPVAAPSLSGVTPVFILNRGDLILPDLQKWAKQSGWTVVWQVPEDWQVPNTTTFSGDFQKAVSQVIQALSANGANVHAVFHIANKTVVINGAGGGE
ncbi:hypothetical protein HF673_03060 [Acidithiobacillus thiooxidans]|uniref:Toxin co-regulated pilus biosynthesis protein Q C-terminal domain-containing protein n=1 Tax=Acidithiobacillus thiooxidans ATCC 19377 TaxID=637390 RepID=A0A5P9XSX1_ACITH|nr:toxin co-regulated pilus biosynthesis Q family protein [Acidithiobacillus thiooxidans]MBU2834789.1 hypothetical protein [Acidithiobacillus thiooxidans]QFX96674.1 hypothetical protein GCD22_02484 [Acidithiobacillus thiooxidans ATCC 19377]